MRCARRRRQLRRDARVKIKKRIADAQADFEARSKKLNEAWDLAKQALAPQHRQ
jgi:hypothetical protein